MLTAELISCVGESEIGNLQGQNFSLHHCVQNDLGILANSHSMSIGGFFFEDEENVA